MVGTFESVRAEALFVSHLQRSDGPSGPQVRRAVAAVLRHWGIRGCAAQVAGEFGDHPETAAPRMAWALDTVREVYRPPTAAPRTAGAHGLPLAG
jgi:hypothetical protein